MKITYLELPDGDKLISYYRHDYKAKKIDGELYSIDGGQFSNLLWVNGNPDKCKVKQDEIDNLIEFIRNDYVPIEKQYLKDVSTKLLEKCLELNKGSVVFTEILKAELKYRNNGKRS